jgi:hypothetical protein
MKRLPCASNGGAVNSIVAYCLVAPYFMVAHGYGNAADATFCGRAVLVLS